MEVDNSRRLGPYTVLGSRGRGGMGEVFEAYDARLDRRVAIKVLHAEALGGPDAHDRVIREARAAARVTHPNVAAVHDVIDADGQPAIVMELVEGRTLASVLKEGPLPADRVVAIGIQLGEAVAAAHAAGVVHRDLKPGNIVLTPSGTIKVLDFGVAKLTQHPTTDETTRPGTPTPDLLDGTRTTGFVGTPRYAAPEQFAGGVVDGRADVFSIGAILFEMVTGRPAFEGADAFAIAMAVAGERTPAVQGMAAGVPRSLSIVISRALRAAPHDRFQSAEDLLAALRGAAASLATTGEAPPRRTAWRSFTLVALTVAALVGIGVVTLRSVSAGPPQVPVVAVLPVANALPDAAAGNVGLAIADSLVAQLAAAPGAVIVTRGATDRYADARDVRRVARDLGATHVVDGTLQRDATRLRLAVTLLRADGSVAWARQFESPPDGLLDLQQEAAEALSTALSLKMTPLVRRQTERSRTGNVEALREYTDGRALLERADLPGNAERAAAAFARSIQLAPNFALGHAGLSLAYWRRYHETSDTRWVARAVAAAEHALRLDPYQADVHVSQATIYTATGRPAEAVEALRQAIALQPRNDNAYAALGDALARQNRPADAIEAYQRAIALRPGFWGHHYRLALFHVDAARHDEAIRELREVIRLQPDSPRGYQALGTIYQMRGDFARARENYEHAIARGPSLNAWSNLGALHHWQGRYEDALHAYEQAVQLAPDEPVFHRNIGDAWMKLGNGTRAHEAYERAVALAEKTLDVDPTSPDARANLAMYEAKIGRVASAVARIDEAAREATADSQVAYARAVVLTFAGRHDEAVDELRRALELGYSRVEAAYDDDLSPLRGRPDYAGLGLAAARRTPGKP